MLTPTLQETLAWAVRYLEALDLHDPNTIDLLHDLRNAQMIYSCGAIPIMPRPHPRMPPEL